MQDPSAAGLYGAAPTMQSVVEQPPPVERAQPAMQNPAGEPTAPPLPPKEHAPLHNLAPPMQSVASGGGGLPLGAVGVTSGGSMLSSSAPPSINTLYAAAGTEPMHQSATAQQPGAPAASPGHDAGRAGSGVSDALDALTLQVPQPTMTNAPAATPWAAPTAARYHSAVPMGMSATALSRRQHDLPSQDSEFRPSTMTPSPTSASPLSTEPILAAQPSGSATVHKDAAPTWPVSPVNTRPTLEREGSDQSLQPPSDTSGSFSLPSSARPMVPGGISMAPEASADMPLSDDSSSSSSSSEDEADESSTTTSTASLHPYAGDVSEEERPDMTQVNRRQPALSPPWDMHIKSSIHAQALCGDTTALAASDKIYLYRRTPEEGAGLTEFVFPQTAEHYAALSNPPSSLSPTSRELRATALAFAPSEPPDSMPGSSDARLLWYGTGSGHLGELDTSTGRLTGIRTNVHTAPVLIVTRVGRSMLCVDESGKISAWVPRGDEPLSLTGTQPRTQRISMLKGSYAAVLGDQLWVCSMAVVPRSSPMQASVRLLQVRMYNPLADDRPFNAVSRSVGLPPDKAAGVGAVTCSTVLRTRPDRVFLGHETGHVSVWSLSQSSCLEVHSLRHKPLSAIAGLYALFWTATRTGQITVYRIDEPVWRPVKSWRAHRDAVLSLEPDRYGFLRSGGTLQVLSTGADQAAHVWDGLLTADWLEIEAAKHASSFLTTSSLRVLDLTYNIDAASPADMLDAVDNMEVFQRILRSSCSFPGSSPDRDDGFRFPDEFSAPDVVVIGLQELIDLDDKRLTAKHLLLGKKRKPGGEFDDRVSRQYRAWHDKLVSLVRVVMPPETPFSVLLSKSMVGLFTCVFVKTSLLPRIRDEAIYTVKRGLGGHYGNKGAIVARFVVDDSSFCFLNCHLAAGQRNVRRRNMDVADILASTPSHPVNINPAGDLAYVAGGDGTLVLDHELCFFAGDLNYRLNLRRDVVLSLLEQKRYDELRNADQLLHELRSNPFFRLQAFREAPIQFPPTYKLNPRSNEWDTSEKARVPAWCDRILWRAYNPETLQCTSYRRWDATLSDHRPVSATFIVAVKLINAERRERVLQGLRTQVDARKREIVAELCREQK